MVITDEDATQHIDPFHAQTWTVAVEVEIEVEVEVASHARFNKFLNPNLIEVWWLD